jgi:hypothetical protein
MSQLNDEHLSERLRTLDREVQPPRDLWPVIGGAIRANARLGGMEPRGISPLRRRLTQIAAGMLLFVAGWVASTRLDRAVAPAWAPIQRADPIAGAVAIQQAGTAYVAAVAQVRAQKEQVASWPVAQAHDVAVAAIQGAVWELLQMDPHDATATTIFEIAKKARQERMKK